MALSALDFEKVKAAIRIFEALGCTVESGTTSFEVYEDGYMLDSFKDGLDMYTAAVYYQKGVFHQIVDNLIDEG